MSRKRFYILFIIVLCRFTTFAQENDSNGFFLESNYQYGFIWQHRPSLADIIDGNINVLQLSFGKETYGQSKWDQLYRYPDWGVGVYFADLGSPEELGLANAIYGYFNIPVIKKAKFQLRYRLTGGVSYLNKGNGAIGSHINCYFDVSIDTRIKLGKQFYLVNAFGTTHFSNGAIKKPNLGLNLFSYRLGLHYDFNKIKPLKIKQELPELEKRNYIVTVINCGVKELNKFDKENYAVVSGVVDYQRRLGYKYKIGTGLDVFYDESLFTTMDPDSKLNISNSDIMRYGIHLSADARIYNLVLAIYIGTYVHADYTKDGNIYQRIAIRYLFSETLFANLSLKTSGSVADFVECGIGYQFRW